MDIPAAGVWGSLVSGICVPTVIYISVKEYNSQTASYIILRSSQNSYILFIMIRYSVDSEWGRKELE